MDTEWLRVGTPTIHPNVNGAQRPSTQATRAYLDNEDPIIVSESKPQNMGPYEMETIILWQLGHDVSER